MHIKLCELLTGTKTGDILAAADDNWEELYKRYLQDFVRSAHQVLHDNFSMEYEVCRQ